MTDAMPPMNEIEASLATRWRDEHGRPQYAAVRTRSGPTNGAIIELNESGCFPVHDEDFDPAAFNAEHGITPEEAMAMEAGSMCGWDVPGAYPETYVGRLGNSSQEDDGPRP